MSSGVTKQPRRPGSVFFDMETLSSGWGTLRGTHVDAVLHDEIAVQVPKHEMIDCSGNLDDNEKRWAAAFRKVYNVGAAFFEKESPAQRRRIIDIYTDLAEKGRGRARDKAAQAVAIVVEYTLEGKVPGSSLWQEVVDFKVGTHSSGNAQDQLDAYRYMLQSMITPEKKP